MNEQQKNYLEMVKFRVLAEPRTLVMQYFGITLAMLKSLGPGVVHFDPDLLITTPDCGSVGCIAGHVCMMDPGTREKYINNSLDVETAAREMLGLPYTEAVALFYFPFPSSEPGQEALKEVYATERRALKNKAPGTVAYAKVVAKAIDKCIARNYKVTRRRAA